MGKAILIFSDGTGQTGGIRFDQDRSNIYKLYRATRCGLDTLRRIQSFRAEELSQRV